MKRYLLIAYCLYICIGLIIAYCVVDYNSVSKQPITHPSIKRGVNIPYIECNITSNSSICGNGQCKNDTFDGKNVSMCKCFNGFVSLNGACDYEQVSKMKAFVCSFFLGEFGADWFLLSKGKGTYIIGGIFKLLTLGCAGIWGMIDWVRVLADSFPDGNGVELAPFN